MLPNARPDGRPVFVGWRTAAADAPILALALPPDSRYTARPFYMYRGRDAHF
jgi:hypothetical protein